MQICGAAWTVSAANNNLIVLADPKAKVHNQHLGRLAKEKYRLPPQDAQNDATQQNVAVSFTVC